MKKLLIALGLTTALAGRLLGQWTVVDPAQIEQNAILHLEDIARYVEMIENQVKQITTLTNQLDRLRFVSSVLGNPATNTTLPGIMSVVESIDGKSPALSRAQMVGAAVANLAHEDTGSGVFRAVGSSFQTRDGQTVARSETAYKPLAAVVQATANHDAVHEDVKARRTQLRAAIKDTLEQLRTAPTDAASQKLQGVLVGLTAELAASDTELEFATQQTVVQDIANRNDRLRQEQAHREEQAAELSATIRKVTESLRPNTKPTKLGRKY